MNDARMCDADDDYNYVGVCGSTLFAYYSRNGTYNTDITDKANGTRYHM